MNRAADDTNRDDPLKKSLNDQGIDDSELNKQDRDQLQDDMRGLMDSDDTY